MKKLNFIQNIELIISHPHKFFDYIKNKKKSSLLEYVFIFAFLSFLTNIIIRFNVLMKDQINLPFMSFIGFLAILLLSMLLFSFFISALFMVVMFIYHMIIGLFTGKERFRQSYKLVYSFTPVFLVSLIPYYSIFKIIFYPLMALAVIDSVYINYVGLRKIQNLTKENAIASIIIFMMLATITLIVLI